MSNEAQEADTHGGPDGAASSDGATSPDRATSGESSAGNSPEGDATVPKVDLSLQELSVSVTGRSADDLETVEQSALTLMEELVETAESLEEERDEYGLS